MTEDKGKNKKIVEEQKARIQAEKEFGQSLSYAQQGLMEQVRALKQQQGLVEGLVRSSKKLNDSTKQNVELKRDLASMYSSELQTANDVVLKRAMVKTQLQGEYAQYLAQYMIQKKIKDVNDPRLKDLIKELKHRQELNDKIAEERDLYEEIAARTLEIREEAGSYKKKLTEVLATAKAIGNDPKTLGAFALNEGVKAVEKLHEGMEQFHEMGMTGGQALEAQMQSLSVASLAGLSDTKGAIQGIYEEYGTLGAASGEITDHIGHLSHEMGISGQEAAKLTAQMQQITGESMAASVETLEYTKNLAKANGVAPGKLTKDIAANTKDIARFSKEGSKGFADAAMKAHKMNVEMNEMVSMADSLLDYESSIEKQMEASALLGREINFDKARQLALEGKSVEATEEVLKQVGGAAEFNKLNVLEQRKLAEAAGLTEAALKKGLEAQEGNVKMTGEAEAAQSGFFANLLMMGGGAVKLMQEYGMAMMVILQFLSSEVAMRMLSNSLLIAKNVILGIGKGIMMSMVFLDKILLGGIFARGAASAANFAREQAQALWTKMTENTLFGQWMANMAARRAARLQEAAQDKALASQKKVSGGGGGAGAGAGKGLRGLAGGLSAMGTGKVLLGALNLLIAAPALLLMVAAIPFLIAISMVGVGAGIGLKAASSGIKSFGNGKVLMGAGVMLVAAASIAALGAATILFAQGGVAGTALMIVSLIALTAALAVLGGLGLSGIGFIGVALVLAVGVAMLLLGAAVLLAAYGISLVVDSFLKMFEVISIENVSALMLLGPALFLIGAGLLVMAAGLFLAAPALLTFGIAALVASIGVGALGIGFMFLGIGVAMVAGGFISLSKVLNMEFVSVLAALVPVAGMLALGLVALGLSALIATPGLVLGAFAVGAFALTMGLLAVALTAAIPGMLTLMQLGSMAGAFAEIALSMAAMAAGITAFATAGILTLPTIMGLIALSFVAPILTELGDSINYDLEGPSKVESDTDPVAEKMDALISEVQGLRAIMAQGGVINMDGKKVGDVLRLNISTSNLK